MCSACVESCTSAIAHYVYITWLYTRFCTWNKMYMSVTRIKISICIGTCRFFEGASFIAVYIWTWLISIFYVPGSKLLLLGMVIPPSIGNHYNGYINPYYWVDDHPRLYGNNGCFQKIVVSQNGWFTMENPIKTHDLGGFPPVFWKRPLWVYGIQNMQHTLIDWLLELHPPKTHTQTPMTSFPGSCRVFLRPKAHFKLRGGRP